MAKVAWRDPSEKSFEKAMPRRRPKLAKQSRVETIKTPFAAVARQKTSPLQVDCRGLESYMPRAFTIGGGGGF
jgi:hypothetical protein